ncbi:MAG TPA: GH116 family glycosyl-hydrolase [Dongiaceae bacterium]|nr:GH116 family glycosyl-hydrolase [Dongiaceae bacterium]
MKPPTCPTPSCACHSAEPSPGWLRRDFLKLLGLSAGALAFPRMQAMAGPFTRQDFEKLVPADKKLRPEWVASLTARGERTIYRGADLDRIGMPVGGLCAGQLYLGGDGKLWHWDIFNHYVGTGAEHYAKPMTPGSPFDHGFALRLTSGGQTREWRLERGHWRDLSFIGEYPIGYVEYRDADCPAVVSLEAFSPFIPLNTEDSSLPATVLEYTVKNHGNAEMEVELTGWLENPICLFSSQTRDGLHRNRLVRAGVTPPLQPRPPVPAPEGAAGQTRGGDGFIPASPTPTPGIGQTTPPPQFLFLECAALEAPGPAASPRPDLVFADFEADTYGKWTVTGTAFGAGPVEIAKLPAYQGDVGGQGKRVVNSHASAPGSSVTEKDAATGTLTSPPFTLERHYITFLVGGGAHQGRTCINLLIGDQVVLTATGRDNNRMGPVSWDVRRWAGQTATLQIVDQESGPWGNIGVDDILFSDRPRQPLGALAQEPDFGTLGLALLDTQPGDFGSTEVTPLAGTTASPAAVASAKAAAARPPEKDPAPAVRPFGQKLTGSLTRKMKLVPGASAKATFVLAWHIPNLKLNRLPPGRYYATRFDSALRVAQYVRDNFTRLSAQTRLWHDTWYDSTLPYWFLDRTFLNTSILATSTCHRFANGRFYGWEGVGCCEGTCGHVWQYAHAVARLFPDLERLTREKVDFGLALQPDGEIYFRGEFNNFPAIDAQAGAILRALREHQASADGAFLKRNWPAIKKAAQWLIAKDGNGDGLIEGNQPNTLDTDWFGPVAWLSGLYLAALLAAETMALELDDQEFAARCRTIFEAGQKNIVAQLYEGEYFINRPDPHHLDAINSGTGCEIDQVFGQSWAFQVGLPRVFPPRETLSALKSLWRYNFTPDVGPYRAAYKPGRWYAMPGEAGLLMCTFPRSDWDYAQARGKGEDWAAGYFNECMNGFEYQAAGHMIWEGLLTEGLAVTRAVHDRYHASRRNPWNEVECGDHYARSMASYGIFLAACGFEYHGPKGRLGFAPRLAPAHFQAAFTTAEGWGTYSQKLEFSPLQTPVSAQSELSLKWGNLRLRTLTLELPVQFHPTTVRVELEGRSLQITHSLSENRLALSLSDTLQLTANQKLSIRLA